MLLSEINGEYQKKRMIVYNADGTKPIVHNIEVAPIFGNIYMSRLEKSDTRSYAACDLACWSARRRKMIAWSLLKGRFGAIVSALMVNFWQ